MALQDRGSGGSRISLRGAHLIGGEVPTPIAAKIRPNERIGALRGVRWVYSPWIRRCVASFHQRKGKVGRSGLYPWGVEIQKSGFFGCELGLTKSKTFDSLPCKYVVILTIAHG